MKGMKKLYALFLCVLITPLLSSCGDDNSKQESPSTTMTAPIAVREGEQTTAIDTPEKKQTTVAAEPSVIDEIKGGDEQELKTTFLKAMKQTGTQLGDGQLLSLRSQVCIKAVENPDLKNIVSVLEDKDLSEEQAGVLIAMSLTTKCPEAKVSFDEELLGQQ